MWILYLLYQKEKAPKKPITMEEIELYFINQFKIAIAKIFEKVILMKREKVNNIF